MEKLLSVWLGNLHAYNEGNLVGEWVDLPMEEGELQKKIDSILEKGGGEEIGIFDYEWKCKYNGVVIPLFEISEYENVWNLNELLTTIKELVDSEGEEVLVKIYALCDIGCTPEEALDKLEDTYFYPDETLRDLAYAFVEEGVYGDIPDSILNYIDYDAIARDLEISGQFREIWIGNDFVGTVEVVY